MRWRRCANLIPEALRFELFAGEAELLQVQEDAQEAHEAVRPTDVSRAPEDVRKYLDDDVFKLYH